MENHVFGGTMLESSWLSVCGVGSSIRGIVSRMEGSRFHSLHLWVGAEARFRAKSMWYSIVNCLTHAQVKMYRAAYAKTMTGIKGSIFTGGQICW